MTLNLVIGAISAATCLILSYLIWNRKNVWLISGSTENVKNKEKLAKCMGIFLIIVGIYLFLLFAFITQINNNLMIFNTIAFCIITLIFRIIVYIKIK